MSITETRANAGRDDYTPTYTSHPLTAHVVYRQHPSRNVTEPISAVRIPVNTNATSGLVLHLAADCHDVRRARRAECILYRLGDAKRSRDDVFRVGLEREQSRQRSNPLIARQHSHARAEVVPK
jgi:hypothetical protein